MNERVFRILAVVILCLAAIADARAQNCTNSDFKGIYAALVTGSFVTPPAPPPDLPAGPSARVGRVEADGVGTSSIIGTLSQLGFVFEETYGAAFTVDSDCSVDVLVQARFPGSELSFPFRFVGVLADSGNSMDLILRNPSGTNLRIALKRQGKDTCSNQDLNGAYSLSLAGINFMVPINPNGVFARVGLVKFDGNGGFDASVYTSYNGIVLSEIFSGTYTVDSTCIFRTQFSLYGFASGWTGVLYNESKGAYLLVSAPEGGVVTGTMTAVK